MQLDKSRKYGEIWGASPIPGARFTQDGNYFGAAGNLLSEPAPIEPPAPVVEPPAQLPATTVSEVEAPVVEPEVAKPAVKSKKAKAAAAAAKASLEDELLKLAE